MKKIMTKRVISVVSSFLLVLAPLISTQTACILLWGEPDCPKSLR